MSKSPFSQPNEGGGPPNDEIKGRGPPDEAMKEREVMQTQSIPEEQLKQMKRGILMNYFKNFFLRIIIKSYMRLYFIISSIIILLGSYRLYKINIFCYEKMRLLFAGEINTIFMNKINILCDDNYEIKGYYPSFQSSKESSVSLQTYYDE